MYLLSPRGQALLQTFGFIPVALPPGRRDLAARYRNFSF